MPYTPTNWVAGTTPLNATNLNNLESQYSQATTSFEQDLFTAFVLSGLVCTKDGSVANQLDVTSGVAFLTQSDNTLKRQAPAASTPGQFVTSTINTTYYLFLKNDGTWQWGTTSTGPTNSLAICQATTDGSGNINNGGVTDKRPLNPSLLSSMLGSLVVPNLMSRAGQQGRLTSDGQAILLTVNGDAGDHYITTGAAYRFFLDQIGDLFYQTAPSGSAGGAITWTTQWGVTSNGAVSKIGGQMTAGSFGVPVIVAQALDVHVTSTAQQTILTYTPGAAGVYEVCFNAYVGGTSNTLTAQVSYTDAHAGSGTVVNPVTVNTGPNPGYVSGLSLGAATGPLPTMPIILESGTGAIAVKYQNSTGTPNDYVSVLIKRLA